MRSSPPYSTTTRSMAAMPAWTCVSHASRRPPNRRKGLKMGLKMNLKIRLLAATAVTLAIAPATKRAPTNESWNVTVDAKTLLATPIGGQVVVQLPGHTPVTIVHEHSERQRGGNVFWAGHVDGQPGSLAEFSVGEDSASGTVGLPGYVYKLSNDATGQSFRAETSTKVAMFGDVAERPVAQPRAVLKDASTSAPTPDQIQQLLAQGDTSTEVVTVDVLLLYSPGLAARLGPGLQQYIDQIWGGVRYRYQAS